MSCNYALTPGLKPGVNGISDLVNRYNGFSVCINEKDLKA
jgi:hypothetical protein